MHENIKKIVFNSLSEDKECSICREPELMTLDDCFVLNCGHVYHKACVKPWLVEFSTCPTCRDDTTKIYHKTTVKWKIGSNDNEATSTTGGSFITSGGIGISRTIYVGGFDYSNYNADTGTGSIGIRGGAY